jgi:hypothetical protein
MSEDEIAACEQDCRRRQRRTDCRSLNPYAAPVYDVIQSFMLTALTVGRRFNQVERLREAPTIPEIIGMEAVDRAGAAFIRCWPWWRACGCVRPIGFVVAIR